MGILDEVYGIQPNSGILNSVDPSVPASGFGLRVPQNPIMSQFQPAPVQAPQAPPSNFMDRLAASPGMPDALIQMGAGMLSQNKLGPGLAAGFAGFAKGATEGMKLSIEQLKLMKPTLTPTGQAGIMLATFPDGTQKTIVVDEAVRAYQAGEDRKDAREQNRLDSSERRTQMMIEAANARGDKSLAQALAIATMKNGPGRPLSSSVQKAEDADFEAIDAHRLTNKQIAPVIQSLTPGPDGKASLDLGALRNKYNESRNFFGKSTPESQAYADLERNITNITNESLRLNKGTQTEGDAQRAVKELTAAFAKNDNALMAKSLADLQRLNETKIGFKQTEINRRRSSQKAEPFDFGTPVAPAGGGGDIVINGVTIKKVQ